MGEGSVVPWRRLGVEMFAIVASVLLALPRDADRWSVDGWLAGRGPFRAGPSGTGPSASPRADGTDDATTQRGDAS